MYLNMRIFNTPIDINSALGMNTRIMASYVYSLKQ